MTSTPTPAAGGEPTRNGNRRRRRGRGEHLVVPEAEFRSYYDRPVVKESPWGPDIPAYLFLGGLAGGSSILAAGASVTGRPGLRRSSRVGAVVAVLASFVALVHDLGRPSRFHHMLRVAKLTSPMSVGTWVLSGFAPAAGVAAAAELPIPFLRRGRVGKLVPVAAEVGGWAAAGLAPALATYTAVLLSDTSTPSWHTAREEMPFVFAASAASAAGGFGMVAAPLAEAGPARALAAGGALAELAIERRMETSMGMAAEPLHQGRAGAYSRAARALTSAGVAATVLAGRRSRVVSVLAGASLLAGSACTRFAIFHAGQQSARDPRYTVVPQRSRLDAGRPARAHDLRS
jgi:formate-dependent nitrite reductase membrane component NrfD